MIKFIRYLSIEREAPNLSNAQHEPWLGTTDRDFREIKQIGPGRFWWPFSMLARNNNKSFFSSKKKKKKNPIIIIYMYDEHD